MMYKISSIDGKLILFATICASGMAFLDGTVVNIAIPVMQSKLHATLSQIQWIINSYALMLASLILISGALGDRFGRKRVFMFGIALFTVSSFLCGISQTIFQLIIFRAVQGIGAAMMIPGSLSIIQTSFEEKIRGKAIGLWAGLAGGVASLGPFLGGWLVQTFGWPSIFYINIPIGITAFYITYRCVPETKNNELKSIDIPGALLLLFGLFGLAYGLMQGNSDGWTSLTISGSLFGGIFALAVFVFVELRRKNSLVPLEIFSSSRVVGANLATLFLYFALSGVIFFLVLNLQQLQHYPPLIAGISLLPSILLITFLSGPAGSLADRIGPRLPMLIGPLLVSIGMASFIFPGAHAQYFTQFLPGLVLFGLGMSIVIAPLTKSALGVDEKYSGAASGVNNAVSRVAGLLAVALLGAIAVFVFREKLNEGILLLHLTQDQMRELLQQSNKLMEMGSPAGLHAAQRIAIRNTIDYAFLTSFRVVMTINAILAFVSAVVAFLTIQNNKDKYMK